MSLCYRWGCCERCCVGLVRNRALNGDFGPFILIVSFFFFSAVVFSAFGRFYFFLISEHDVFLFFF